MAQHPSRHKTPSTVHTHTHTHTHTAKRFEVSLDSVKMSGKVVLHYFNGRGKMESVRWLLAAAGVEFEEVFLTKREHYDKLVKDGALMFQQVPMVEIDGMRLVQSRAILNYISEKYKLCGKDLKERAFIDMYTEGTIDLMELMMKIFFTPAEDKQKLLSDIEQKAKERYLPVFETGLANSDFLVGNQLSRADVHLLEVSLMLQELFPTILATFPKIQAFQEKMKALPRIRGFLQPGSARKPAPDEVYVKTVKEVLSHVFK